MTHEIKMRGDGILRLAFVGDIGREDMEALLEDFLPLLESVTATKPLCVLVDASRVGQVSAKVRKVLAELDRDPRIGKTVVLGSNRYLRVMAGFVLKAAGRDNVKFCDLEEEALAWLKAGG